MHVGDVGDVKYLNKRSKGNTIHSNVTHVRDVGDVKYLNTVIT